MQMQLIVGDWGNEIGARETLSVEVPEPMMTETEIIHGYEVENSEERKKLDYWAAKYVFPQARTGPVVDGWISVYFAGPETFALYDCEYNFDAETGRVIGNITVRLEIENVYELYENETTHATATIPEPPAEGEARDDWAMDHLFPLTGTGREGGDSAYFVTITECPERPDLVNAGFEFGL